MSKSLTKDTIRNITKSYGRFISILMIVALGVAFFVGIKSSPLDMQETADHYFDEYNLMDIRLISPFGFNADDVLAIEEAEGIEGVFPTYTKDVLTNVNAKEFVLRIHGLPIDQIAEDNQNYINRVNVIEGRLPQKSGEAVVEKSGYSESFEIGATITLESGTDTQLDESLKTCQYTIVGFVETPYYLSFEKGSTSIGSGMVESFMMIPQDDFIMDVYTDVYATVENSKPLMTFDSAYADVVDPMVDKLETIGISRAKIRYDEIIDESTTELNSAKAEYESEKAKAEIELADAAKQIEDAKLELANGEKELANQRAEFDKTIADANTQITEGEAQLINGENELNKGYNSFLESKPGIESKLNEADQQIKAGESELNKLQPVIAQLKQALEDVTLTEEERGALVAKLLPLEATYNQTKATLDAAKLELEAGRTALVDGENKLLAAKRTIQYQKEELEKQKETLETEKANALNEFAKARQE
ncbi:MAG: ABC transporter permease, partial [Turicibacter sp.]